MGQSTVMCSVPGANATSISPHKAIRKTCGKRPLELSKYKTGSGKFQTHGSMKPADKEPARGKLRFVSLSG
jgi:hypothetical protein